MKVATFKTRSIVQPSDFCRKYSRYTPDMWGYRKQWNMLLARVLDIGVSTVAGWGADFEECPERYKRLLDMADALMTAETALKKHGLSRDELEPED